MKTDSRFSHFRAVVRTFTSPRRVGFWVVTLPVLLGPVALYLVMRPGVKFNWSTQVGAGEAGLLRADDSEGRRSGTAYLHWPGVSVGAECLVPVAGKPARPVDPTIHRLGPLSWTWKPGRKLVAIDARWFGLGVWINH